MLVCLFFVHTCGPRKLHYQENKEFDFCLIDSKIGMLLAAEMDTDSVMLLTLTNHISSVTAPTKAVCLIDFGGCSISFYFIQCTTDHI